MCLLLVAKEAPSDSSIVDVPLEVKNFLDDFVDMVLDELPCELPPLRNKKNGGIVVNLIGTTSICFSHFFYAFLCLCCLRTSVRSLGTVCVGS